MQELKKVVVIGASGFGREALDTLEAMQAAGAEFEVEGVVDDAPSEINLERLEQRGIRYLGNREDWLAREDSAEFFVLGIGAPAVRRMLAGVLEAAGKVPFQAIHPTAVIGSNAELAQSVVVCARAVISTNVHLGNYVHVNPNATLGHDARIEDFSSINPAAIISGEVLVESEVLIGAGATVLQQLSVGQQTVVGAGAVVTKNVPAEQVVVGVPGRWGSPDSRTTGKQ